MHQFHLPYCSCDKNKDFNNNVQVYRCTGGQFQEIVLKLVGVASYNIVVILSVNQEDV